jgi:hypothetical protein
MAIVFIPGIKGSELVDSYPLDWPRRWSLEDMVVGDIVENPLDFTLAEGRYDATDGHWMRASRLIYYAYGAMINKLRAWRAPFDGVGRTVFIAPPFRGSIGAPYALVVGEKDGWFGTDEDYRRIARTFPSVYQMTPSWPGAAVDEDGRALDLFDAANWQRNVLNCEEFGNHFLADAEAFVRGRAARHGGSSPAPMLADTTLARAADKVLVLCGAGLPTRRSLPVQTRNVRNPNWFDFPDTASDKHGDGRVHLLSAAVKGVTLAVFAGSGEHAVLCRDERVTNLTSLWLEGKKALRMTRRGPQHSEQRPSRSYFGPWNGDPSSFDKHIV